MQNLLVIGVSVLVFVAPSYVFAEPWTLSVDANLTLTENAYSDSWVGGEAGAISWASGLNSLAEKQLHTKVRNKNTLKLSFGQTHNQNKETKEWAKPEKSTDLIDFETFFLLTLGGPVDPYVAGRIESQFFDVRDPEKHRYINPTQFTESFGAAKVLMKKQKRELTTRLGAAFRQHLDRDVLVDPVENERENQSTTDIGLESVTDFTTPLAEERITYTSKLTIYKALFYSESEELEGQPQGDYWKSPDVNWENIFTASITSYLMVNLYVQLLYDKEIDKRARIKQTLALGLTYKLM
jgi:hypothetical protein